MIDVEFQLALASQLLVRLERLSADSYWAHRASGLRGSLIKCVSLIESARGINQSIDQESWQKLKSLTSRGFEILEKAAREIRVRDLDQG